MILIYLLCILPLVWGATVDYGLVVTGGDNPNLIKSSAIISSSGVCTSPALRPGSNIPDLLHGIAGAKSVWIQDGRRRSSPHRLMLCGGSQTYRGGDPVTKPWITIDTCRKVKPGATRWISHASMNFARGWFSMNNINNKEVVAAGGMTTGGAILNSLEKYSFPAGSGSAVWGILTNETGSDITLPFVIYGHCAVLYTCDTHDFLMIIGGSSNSTDKSHVTNAVTVINLNTGQSTTPPAGELPPLWAPACTKKGGDIYVSGGAPNGGNATNEVYKGTIYGNFKRIGSGLSKKRSGHTMGVSSMGSPGRLKVAGGFNVLSGQYLTEVETSTDDGETWITSSTPLAKGGEYAAMASVPIGDVRCP